MLERRLNVKFQADWNNLFSHSVVLLVLGPWKYALRNICYILLFTNFHPVHPVAYLLVYINISIWFLTYVSTVSFCLFIYLNMYLFVFLGYQWYQICIYAYASHHPGISGKMKSVPCPNRKTIENSEHLEDIWYVFSGRWYFQTKRPFCVSVFKFRWFFRRVWLVSKEGSKSTLVTFDFAPNGCFPCCYVRERRVQEILRGDSGSSFLVFVVCFLDGNVI